MNEKIHTIGVTPKSRSILKDTYIFNNSEDFKEAFSKHRVLKDFKRGVATLPSTRNFGVNFSYHENLRQIFHNNKVKNPDAKNESEQPIF